MEWRLGLSAWIIQDGNYGDFRRGARAELAVEIAFHRPPVHVEADAPAAHHVHGSTYDVVGRIVAIEADVSVIDIGISVFYEGHPLPGVFVGDVIAGRVYVGVDPFTYFEHLAKRASIPPLIYTWRLLDVARQTAPTAWLAVDRTQAWTDDDGNAEYALRGALLDEPAKRTRTT